MYDTAEGNIEPPIYDVWGHIGKMRGVPVF